MSRTATTAARSYQLVQSIDVGFAAFIVHLVQRARGDDHLTWQAVSPALLAIGAVTLVTLA